MEENTGDWKRFKLLRPSPANARGASTEEVLKGVGVPHILTESGTEVSIVFANVCTQPLWGNQVVFNTFEDDSLRLTATILNKFSRRYSVLRHPIPSEPPLLQRPCFSLQRRETRRGVLPWVPECSQWRSQLWIFGTSSLHFSIETVLQHWAQNVSSPVPVPPRPCHPHLPRSRGESSFCSLKTHVAGKNNSLENTGNGWL